MADSAIAEFNTFKLSSNPGKYMLLKIEGGSIVVDKTSEDSDFSNFLAELHDDDCRYAVYKKTVEFDDGRSSEKLVLISWIPDTVKVKAKMVYAGSKDAVNRALTGIMVKLNVTDVSELTEKALVAECKKFN